MQVPFVCGLVALRAANRVGERAILERLGGRQNGPSGAKTDQDGLEPLRNQNGPSGAQTGPNWSLLGAILRQLFDSIEDCFVSEKVGSLSPLGHLDSISEPLGSQNGSSWSHFGAKMGHPEAVYPERIFKGRLDGCINGPQI